MSTRATDLQNLKNWLDSGYDWILYVESEQSAAVTHYLAGEDHDSIYHLCNCAIGCAAALKDIYGRFSPYSPSYILYHFLLYHTVETAPVTMDSIINAMLAATSSQLQKFIGIEDAYRCALWDAPFNEDFYAALARGFKKW